MQNFAPAKISSTFSSVRSVADALASHSPSLCQLAKSEGCNTHVVKVLFKMHLVALDRFLKQKVGLSPDEIELITDEVFFSFGHMLSFADIHLVFRNAKLGRYGELYNNLSAAKIVAWFEQYANERCETAYHKNLEEDKVRYGNHPKDSAKMLASMGYEISPDGKISINQAVVAQNNAQRQAAHQATLQAQQDLINAHNDYLRHHLQ